MLEDCLLDSRRSARRRKPLTLVISVATHGSLVAALALVPLFQERLLPHVALFDPIRPPEARAEVVKLVPTAHQSAGASAAPAQTALIAPLEVPKVIAVIVDEPNDGIAGLLTSRPGAEGGNSSLSGLLPSPGAVAAAPPPLPPSSPPPASPKPPEPTPAPVVPVRRGGDVVMSNLVHQVRPIYPVLAQKTRTQGIVLLEAVILRDGTIDPARIRVVTGNVLLNEAAIEAVKQWRYKPTLLNQEAVEILTTITVNFTFN